MSAPFNTSPFNKCLDIQETKLYIPPNKRDPSIPPVIAAASQAAKTGLSFLRASSTGVYIPPHKINPTNKNDLLLSGAIKKVKETDIFRLVNGEYKIHGQQISMNAVHWVLLLSRIVDGILNLSEDEISLCIKKMREQLKQCEIGRAAQIIKLIGNLQINDPETQIWITTLLVDSLSTCKDLQQKELFMLFCGAVKTLDRDKLDLILNKLEPMFRDSHGKYTRLFLAMEPNTLGVLALCCENTSFHSDLWKEVWNRIKLKREDFNYKEITYLLRNSKKTPASVSDQLIKAFEQRILHAGAQNWMPIDKLIDCWLSFTNHQYVSGEVQEKIESLLKGNSLTPQQRFAILYGYAQLGNKQHKELLISLLKETINDLKGYSRMFRSEILYTITTMLGSEEIPEEITSLLTQ